jgi:hypothetical protein
MVGQLSGAKEAAVKLKTNVGNLDLLVRVGVGLGLVMLMAVGLIGAWGLIGLVLIATGASRWCPLYSALGTSTTRHVHHAAAPQEKAP